MNINFGHPSNFPQVRSELLTPALALISIESPSNRIQTYIELLIILQFFSKKKEEDKVFNAFEWFFFFWTMNGYFSYTLLNYEYKGFV